MIAFPGGIGTLQEMIVPMMHHKLDVSVLNLLKGPASIFAPTELKNPVTDFLKILDNCQFISNSSSPHIILVMVNYKFDIQQLCVTRRYKTYFFHKNIRK
jgi:predicted Rossmann-fold nucleotide-binding protein